MPHIVEIYRYPVKGLSAQPMQRVSIGVGQVIPFDRAYALENGPSAFNPHEPKWIAKIAFLMLMRHDQLAGLNTHFDTETHALSIKRNGSIVAEENLGTEDGRRKIEAFFDGFVDTGIRGPSKVISAPGFSFQDTSSGMVVSLINLESVRDIGHKIATNVDPLRFRGNLHVEGLSAWEESDWVGREVVAGGVRFQVTKLIDRCAAIDVDPVSGARDLNLPRTMMQIYGHLNCGVYLKVIESGAFSVGDTIAPDRIE
jgi:uncharacterized protein